MNKEYYNDDGKVIGWVEELNGSMVFRKKVYESKHLMRKLDAWGIDESVYESIKSQWVEKLQVLDAENSTLYEIPFGRFESNMIVRDYGFGRQVFVPRQYWDIKTNK